MNTGTRGVGHSALKSGGQRAKHLLQSPCSGSLHLGFISDCKRNILMLYSFSSVAFILSDNSRSQIKQMLFTYLRWEFRVHPIMVAKYICISVLCTYIIRFDPLADTVQNRCSNYLHVIFILITSTAQMKKQLRFIEVKRLPKWHNQLKTDQHLNPGLLSINLYLFTYFRFCPFSFFILEQSFYLRTKLLSFFLEWKCIFIPHAFYWKRTSDFSYIVHFFHPYYFL